MENAHTEELLRNHNSFFWNNLMPEFSKFKELSTLLGSGQSLKTHVSAISLFTMEGVYDANALKDSRSKIIAAMAVYLGVSASEVLLNILQKNSSTVIVFYVMGDFQSRMSSIDFKMNFMERLSSIEGLDALLGCNIYLIDITVLQVPMVVII